MLSKKERARRLKASREIGELVKGPMWPNGLVAQACRPCRLYLGDVPVCPQCGRDTVGVIVFNNPNQITEDDLKVTGVHSEGGGRH